ncbi:response regulator [Nodularia spumigena CS-584]|jgi:two-component system, chemotaxis family, response regulator PixH|uniref:Twitching motility two-component system response regulator PilH n=2 Tax=Nodularia spumigena TaxID=70799 RepID=A0A2S0QAB9_NODSP|nr:response regulator [Nodularia spumigena]AHJ30264.1 Two-component response regulator [Nodularia spumigena CCY9414]AVZ31311.1 twitching motility two-component system response regulator PilH [Nodularia spumigena UHCC 0039]EAW46615.1 two-component system, regulatory protein [Nodularia spumigena CCY9414]MDB9382311.1 response regulator [Nodularia spumigena CS-584]MEA5525806.1 response regulator [Nodularia spumigena UHCC 0143]
MSVTLVGKILIVEDSPSELELMSYYLQDTGWKVIKAASGKEALEKVLSEQPDAIVTDVVMPEMSGFELCRLLKKNSTTQKLPIVICSSKNQEIDRLWAMKQGADVYLTKPYTREQLLTAIKSVVL